MRTRIDTPGGDVTGPKLACLHHLESPFLGAAEAPLRAARLTHHDRLAGDPLPDLDAVDGLVSFGGAQSVTEIERYPYLLEETELLRAAVERDLPVLGVCLGAQLLAHALGGSVRRLPRRAVVWVELARLADDELVPDPVWALHWNEDGIEPPPGATELLERGGLGCAAFRIGSAWGVQFHADVDGAVLDRWYERLRRLGRAGRRHRRRRAGRRRRAPARPAADRRGDLRRLRQTRSSSAKPCAEVSSVTCVRRDSSRSAPLSTSRHAPASSPGSASVRPLWRAHRHDDEHLAVAARERAHVLARVDRRVGA